MLLQTSKIVWKRNLRVYIQFILGEAGNAVFWDIFEKTFNIVLPKYIFIYKEQHRVLIIWNRKKYESFSHIFDKISTNVKIPL